MKQATTTKNIIHQVYGKVILLTFFSHILFMAFFAILSAAPLVFYNIGSCIAYIGIYILSQKNHLRTTVILIHLEICLFVAISYFYLGWGLGFSMYLVALSSLVYFCPFKRKYIPYLFSFTEIILFLLLKVHSMYYPPILTLSSTVITAFYIFNSLASFTLILYAAFVSKLSAVMTEQTLKQSNLRLQNLVNHDSLTHLWSRPHLNSKFDEIIREDVPVTIVLTDIDDFKKINDSYGHDCGDYILSELANLLKSVCPADTGICRWGGEEFVLLFHHTTPNAVISVVDDIRKAVMAHHFKYHKHTILITMTLGVSNSTESTDLHTLICLADKRMYYGKRSGKNTVISSDFKLPAD